MDNNKKLRSKSRLEHHKNIFERKKGELIQLKTNLPNVPISNKLLNFKSQSINEILNQPMKEKKKFGLKLFNKGVKKGLNFNNNKLFAFPSNNYKQIFKRSESTGFINLYNNNKSNRAIKNTSTSKKFNGLSNSLANLGIINNSKEKKIKRNASDLFLS